MTGKYLRRGIFSQDNAYPSVLLLPYFGVRAIPASFQQLQIINLKRVSVRTTKR